MDRQTSGGHASRTVRSFLFLFLLSLDIIILHAKVVSADRKMPQYVHYRVESLTRLPILYHQKKKKNATPIHWVSL